MPTNHCIVGVKKASTHIVRGMIGSLPQHVGTLRLDDGISTVSIELSSKLARNIAAQLMLLAEDLDASNRLSEAVLEGE